MLEQVATRCTSKVLLGAGTVLDPETARIAMLSGAEFIVTPVVRPEVIAMCRRYDKIIVPGALTPTEILTAWEAGADIVKLFPSEQLGPGYLKNIKGPLPQVRLMPTGGVNLETAAAYIKAGVARWGWAPRSSSRTRWPAAISSVLKHWRASTWRYRKKFGIKRPDDVMAEPAAQYDLLSLGECMVRLSPPGHERVEFAKTLEMWVGGGEYNVAYALARLGMRTGFLSRLVDNPLGRLIVNHGRAAGVDMGRVIMAPYDGVGRADRIGLNFTEVGTGVRPSITMYDRGHSAASHLHPGMIDFAALFREQSVRWLHTGGIFTALSEGCAAVCHEALRAARLAGTMVSYDLNFRSKLWSSAQAQQVTRGAPSECRLPDRQ